MSEREFGFEPRSLLNAVKRLREVKAPASIGEAIISQLDSAVSLKEFLQTSPDRNPTTEELKVMAPALYGVYERLVAARSTCPKADVSERVWSLMALVGILPKPVRSGLMRSAASFL